MDTTWPRVAKIQILFDHALIWATILAKCGENHYAFWPRLTFGHPSVSATHSLILATHAFVLATLASFWRSFTSLLLATLHL